MAAVHSTVHRKTGQIFKHDHVQWFDQSTFELRHGVVTAICGADQIEVADDENLTHLVPATNARLWCFAGQPRPVSLLTANSLNDRLNGLEETVYSRPSTNDKPIPSTFSIAKLDNGVTVTA